MATLDSQSQIETPNVSKLKRTADQWEQNKQNMCLLQTSVDSFIDQAHGGVKQTGTAIDAASQYTVATKA